MVPPLVGSHCSLLCLPLVCLLSFGCYLLVGCWSSLFEPPLPFEMGVCSLIKFGRFHHQLLKVSILGCIKRGVMHNKLSNFLRHLHFYKIYLLLNFINLLYKSHSSSDVVIPYQDSCHKLHMKIDFSCQGRALLYHQCTF